MNIHKSQLFLWYLPGVNGLWPIPICIMLDWLYTIIQSKKTSLAPTHLYLHSLKKNNHTHTHTPVSPFVEKKQPHTHTHTWGPPAINHGELDNSLLIDDFPTAPLPPFIEGNYQAAVFPQSCEVQLKQLKQLHLSKPSASAEAFLFHRCHRTSYGHGRKTLKL